MARDYHREYIRRNSLARLRGFRNEYQQRRYGRPRREVDILNLPEAARERRNEALHVWRLASKERISLEASASQLGVDPGLVRWWIPETLGQRKRGQIPLSRRSPLEARPIVFADTEHVEFIGARGWKRREAEEIFRIQWAAAHGMATADELDWLRGRKVAGRPVADTQERLNEIARRGEIDPVEAYRGLVA